MVQHSFELTEQNIALVLHPVHASDVQAVTIRFLRVHVRFFSFTEIGESKSASLEFPCFESPSLGA
jgi:hypothetical protein